VIEGRKARTRRVENSKVRHLKDDCSDRAIANDLRTCFRLLVNLLGLLTVSFVVFRGRYVGE
jgi:hypothetical protein